MRELKILILCFLIGACTTTMPPPENDILLPEIDVIQVKENSDEALKLASEAKLDVDVLTGKVTDFSNQLLNFQEEIKTFSPAKFEELENKLLVLSEELRMTKEQLTEVKNAAPAIAAIQMKAKTKKGGGPDGFEPTAEMKQQTYQDQQEKRYRNAKSIFNNGKFREAIGAFKETVSFAPNGKYVDACHYWIGACYFNLQNYAEAIASLTNVFAYPKSQKRDDAQLKIAICYEKLGDTP
ncbi:MAG: tetratricopeptide repeat protein, partial [bacterium]